MPVCTACEHRVTIHPPDMKGEFKCTECGRLQWTVEPKWGVTIVNCTEYTLTNRHDVVLAEHLFDAGHRKLLLNFGEVQRIGSESLGLLIRLHQSLQAAPGRLALCNVCPDIDRVLRITRLKKLLNIHSDLEEALRSF